MTPITRFIRTIFHIIVAVQQLNNNMIMVRPSKEKCNLLCDFECDCVLSVISSRFIFIFYYYFLKKEKTIRLKNKENK